MKKISIFTILLTTVAMSYSTTYHSGTISSSETWYAADNPHYISSSLSITSGATLTVQAGCNITMYGNVSISSNSTMTINQSTTISVGGLFYEDPPGSGLFTWQAYYFDVDGTLDADGASGSRVTFTKDVSNGWGGIRYNSGSNGDLEYCTLEYAKKSSTSSYSINATYCGGAVFISGTSSNIGIEDCIFRYNEASAGAAIYCTSVDNSTNISDNEFYDNTAYDGGAVGLYAGDCLFKWNELHDNDADNDGGALYLINGSEPDIHNNKFYDNTADDDGGAIYMEDSDPQIYTCLLYDNTSSNDGGAIYFEDSGPDIYNCTICDNSANSGGGVYYTGNTDPEFRNNIIYFNSSGQVYPNPNNNTGLYYNCDIANINFSTQGNINDDPVFVDRNGRNYRISDDNDTPCKDKGDGSTAYTNLDLKGHPRVEFDTIDIGAYEYEIDAEYKIAPKDFQDGTCPSFIYDLYCYAYQCNLKLHLPESGHVEVVMTGLSGKTNKILFNQIYPEGKTTLEWGQMELSSGIYLISIYFNGARQGVEKVWFN